VTRTQLALGLALSAALVGCKDPLEVSPAQDHLPPLSAQGQAPEAPALPPVEALPLAEPAPAPAPAAEPEAGAPSPPEPSPGPRAHGRHRPDRSASVANGGEARRPADLKLTRLVVSRGVTGREPVGNVTTIPSGDVVRV
jgi:hypothetical protein